MVCCMRLTGNGTQPDDGTTVSCVSISIFVVNDLRVGSVSQVQAAGDGRYNACYIQRVKFVLLACCTAGMPETEKLRFFSGFVSCFDPSTRNPKWVLEYITKDSLDGEGTR